MDSLWDVPISSVIALSPDRAVTIMRAILRSECAYAKLGPSVLTISEELTVPDGGLDAEVDVPLGHRVPSDCFFQHGLTGIQIKSGRSFEPWKQNSIRGELLDGKGEVKSEVKRVIQRQGRYTLVCTGHDLTSERRNNSKSIIANVLKENGFEVTEGVVDVLGAGQVAEFSERYPGVVSNLTVDPVQEAWILEEWRHDAHMMNELKESPEQAKIISDIQSNLRSETKHIRVLGEAGLGKTRLVLEALKGPSIAPYVLYVAHGSRFGQTKLFRQLVKVGRNKPLVVVIDELTENELSEIWTHLKSRCGYLKIISLDHGQDVTHDEEIERLNVPYLSSDTIKKILIGRLGESRGLDRWVEICEGSPRVAHAVAENLRANPKDLLKSPTTVPIWTRYLHGYGDRSEESSRQIECVAQYLALFSRFGYEDPVGDEARYISELIQSVDPSIGWARFQEIIQYLRSRRALQGSRTLFFVPKALHIYLWKQFWECYGQSFNFQKIIISMPESLHSWFMSMFKYAGEAKTTHIIEDITKPSGFLSQNEILGSQKGAQFLSILAEANPGAVLRLLEATLGRWKNEELLRIIDSRQQPSLPD